MADARKASSSIMQFFCMNVITTQTDTRRNRIEENRFFLLKAFYTASGWTDWWFTNRPHEINCVRGFLTNRDFSADCEFFLFFFFGNRALPVASSPRSEQRRTWLIFAKHIEILQVKAGLHTFKARSVNLKLLKTIVKKRKKTQSTCEGRSCPPPSIDRWSPQPRSLQVSFQIFRVWFL